MSYEGKRFGVKTGTRVREARRLCPEMVFVRLVPKPTAGVVVATRNEPSPATAMSCWATVPAAGTVVSGPKGAILHELL